MAGKALICNGKLFDKFGYTARTEASRPSSTVSTWPPKDQTKRP